MEILGTPRTSLPPLAKIRGAAPEQRVGRDERKPKIHEFKGFGHLVTLQVKKMTKNDQMVFRQ